MWNFSSVIIESFLCSLACCYSHNYFYFILFSEDFRSSTLAFHFLSNNFTIAHILWKFLDFWQSFPSLVLVHIRREELFYFSNLQSENGPFLTDIKLIIIIKYDS